MSPAEQLNDRLRRRLRAATDDMNASGIESIKQERGKNVARLVGQLLCPHKRLATTLAMVSGQRATRATCITCNADVILD